MSNLADLEMPAYGEPDPEFPMPSVSVRVASGLDIDCDDEHILERWRMSNDTHRTEWTYEDWWW